MIGMDQVKKMNAPEIKNWIETQYFPENEGYFAHTCFQCHSGITTKKMNLLNVALSSYPKS